MGLNPQVNSLLMRWPRDPCPTIGSIKQSNTHPAGASLCQLPTLLLERSWYTLTHAGYHDCYAAGQGEKKTREGRRRKRRRK